MQAVNVADAVASFASAAPSPCCALLPEIVQFTTAIVPALSSAPPVRLLQPVRVQFLRSKLAERIVIPPPPWFVLVGSRFECPRPGNCYCSNRN